MADDATRSFRKFSFRAITVVLFFAALWLGLWWQLSGEWSVNDQYSYGWFVPFFAIVLFWLRWDDWPQADRPAGYQLSVNRYPEEAASEVGDHKPDNRERITDNGKAAARAFAIVIAVAAVLLLFPIRRSE